MTWSYAAHRQTSVTSSRLQILEHRELAFTILPFYVSCNLLLNDVSDKNIYVQHAGNKQIGPHDVGMRAAE